MGIGKLLLKRHIKAAIKNGLKIGKDYYIHTRVDFGSEPYLITIGDHVRITDGVRFITHDGGVWVFRNEKGFEDIDSFGAIVIGDNVHIGNNAIIMPGVHIGDNVVIGCGAVVTKDIPPNSIAAGVPARVIETTGEYRKKIKEKSVHTHFMTFKEKRTFLENYFLKK